MLGPPQASVATLASAVRAERDETPWVTIRSAEG